MDRQRARIANIGNMVKQLEIIDEGFTGLDAAFKFKTDKRTLTAAHHGVSALAGFAVHQ